MGNSKAIDEYKRPLRENPLRTLRPRLERAKTWRCAPGSFFALLRLCLQGGVIRDRAPLEKGQQQRVKTTGATLEPRTCERSIQFSSLVPSCSVEVTSRRFLKCGRLKKGITRRRHVFITRVRCLAQDGCITWLSARCWG